MYFGNNKHFYHIIGRAKVARAIGVTAGVFLSLLFMLSAFPIIDNTEDAEATPGVEEVPTITITSATGNTASVDITPTSANGTFAYSDASSQLAFTVSTGNYTGYTLSIKASDNAGQLTNATYGETLDSITTITTESDFSSGAASTYNNKWGYKPSRYVDTSTGTVIDNTVANNFLPAPTTTETLLDNQTTATTQNYTIDVGARVDYTKPIGTYTNTYSLITVANPVAYHIEYWDLAGISSTTLDDGGLTWNNPASGTAKEATYHQIADQNSATNTGATITLAPIDTTTGTALATPTRHTYTFAGWCRNNTDHSKIGVNQTITAIQNSSNKVTAYNNPSTMCNGAIPDYTTSTDDFIKAGDTTFKLDPTLDNTNLILTAVYKPTTFAEAGIAANANMQTMTNAICKAATPNQFTTLKDARGSSASTYVSYTIIKLMDGNCWMADNLDLDVYAYRNNLTTSNTHAHSTSLNYFINGGNTSTTNRYPTGAINSSLSSAYTDSSPVSHSTQDWSSSYSYTVPLANRHGSCSGSASGRYPCIGVYETASYTHTKAIDYLDGVTTKPYTYGVGSYKIGTYYNYCAASAGYYCYDDTHGAGDSSYDICPAGWKLPAGGASGNYQSLYNKISNITTTPNGATNLLSLQTMLSTPVSGNYNGGTAYRQGTYGFFWSSSFTSTSDMYRMYVSGTAVYPQSSHYRYNGIPVRCIAQS